MLNPPEIKKNEGARLKRKQRFIAGMVDYSVNQRDSEERQEERNQWIQAFPEPLKPSDSSDEERPPTYDDLNSGKGQVDERKGELIMSGLLESNEHKRMNAQVNPNMRMSQDKPQLNADDILEELLLCEKPSIPVEMKDRPKYQGKCAVIGRVPFQLHQKESPNKLSIQDLKHSGHTRRLRHEFKPKEH